eukprot:3715550-Rhodomonas_salina.1
MVHKSGYCGAARASRGTKERVIDVMSRIESAGDGAGTVAYPPTLAYAMSGSSDPDASITSLASNESEPCAPPILLRLSYAVPSTEP